MSVGPSIACVIFVVLMSAAAPARAHRLDEYLQATTIDLEKERVAVQIRLTPGVEVIRAVLGVIDGDGNGEISQREQRAYAERVMRDLSLVVDGQAARLRLISATFPSIGQMKEGLGDIELNLEADVPAGGGNRRLAFENRHQRAVSAYLANCLVPGDPDLRITAQRRNEDQSRYEVEYTQPNVPARGVPPAASWSTVTFWTVVNAVVLGAWGAVGLWRRWAVRAAATGKPIR